jgi:hypothetical protein
MTLPGASPIVDPRGHYMVRIAGRVRNDDPGGGERPTKWTLASPEF